VPVIKKTQNSNSRDRKVYPQTADKPKAVGSPKAANRTKAATKSSADANRTNGAAGKPKPAATKSGADAKPRKITKALPSLKTVVLDALSDMKALEVKVLDVRGLTDIADFMVIASGTSDRHVRSAAQRVVERTKEAGFRPHGVEGQQDSDWVLIDLNEMIVHVMLPRVREFYGLEKLWDMTATKRAARA
jgi:ribosome silencing factor RsfS/YbeB/iojap